MFNVYEFVVWVKDVVFVFDNDCLDVNVIDELNLIVFFVVLFMDFICECYVCFIFGICILFDDFGFIGFCVIFSEYFDDFIGIGDVSIDLFIYVVDYLGL